MACLFCSALMNIGSFGYLCALELDDIIKSSGCGLPCQIVRHSVHKKRGIMRCESCGIESPTKAVTLYQNIGMLVMRRSQTIKGSLCKPCIDSYFWRFTLVNATLGWWGLISLIMTPIFLINNLIQFIGSRSLGEVYTGTNILSGTAQPFQVSAQCPHCQSTQTGPAKLP